MKPSNFYKWIPTTLLVIGCISLLYFLYLSMVYGPFYITFSWSFIGIGIIFILYAFIELKIKKHLLSYLPKYIRISIITLLIIGITIFTSLESYLVYKGNTFDKTQAKTAIVLGAQLNGSSISRLLRYRLESAIEFANNYPDSTLIVSGGKGKGEDISEARAMKDYLTRHGIEESRILMEEASTNTYENFKFSKKLLSTDPSLTVITNDFHMFRASYIGEKQGISCSSYPARSDRDTAINFYFREFFGSIKDILL